MANDEITFYGGAQEVGRSCVNVYSKIGQIMLDCGIKLGDPIEYPIIPKEDFKKIKHIVPTHTHLDHIGFLPHIIQKGKAYNAKIYATKPTRDLMQLLLSDYQRLQEKKLFSTKDVETVLEKTQQVEYKQKISGKGLIPFTLYNSGHILGGAMIKLEGKCDLLYTGDLNLRETKIIEGAELGLKAKNLILESTYGGKTDRLPSLKNASQQLIESIKETLIAGGHVLIPTFAVGRGQNIMMVIESYMRSGALPKVPIYTDGMVNRANRIYRHNVIYAKEEIKMRILMSDEDPFKSPFYKVPKTKDRSDVLSEPCIILSTSGMLTGGPVLNYLEKLIENPKNKLIIVGYQVEGSLGRKLLDGEKYVQLGYGEDKKEYEVKMKVETVPFSGHSDHDDLIKFVKSIKGLKKVFLMHGEPKKIQELAEDIQQNKKVEVIMPKNTEIFKL
ncbi:MAG: MBL fold metallo-hydrolase RNA specificity domain-containing protein [Candidatus Micrarchaeia archaeon]|jgi:hypothetical protein